MTTFFAIFFGLICIVVIAILLWWGLGLQRYINEHSDIVAAGKEAEEIRQEARQQFDTAKSRAEQGLKIAEKKAQAIIDKAGKEAQAITDSAHNDAKSIINKAHSNTEQLTQQIGELTKVADTLKNRIDGYDIEYMIPSIGLLDELAANFGHTEAGQRLKEARTEVRKIIRAGQVAHVGGGYRVPAEQQNTALSFIVGVFNGTVEDILSRVRSDNYGMLAQEIKDVAVLVSRGTTILAGTKIEIAPTYIESRLEELKWATIVHEFRVQAQEEQRAIREQIREDEKVRREIAKARKEADKEAALAQKIYDELQQKFAAMSAEERAAHQKELEEAEERIRLAEEKGQRALSMAQQTKQGHVYIISNIGSFGENIYKIGVTRRLDPAERVRELGGASVPFPFDIHGMIHFDDAPTAEFQLHRLFLTGQVNKTNVRKEFFRANLDDIKSAVERLGGVAHWTMLADAAQYRETLRIEERLANDPAYRQQWEERQIRLESLSLSLPEDEGE